MLNLHRDENSYGENRGGMGRSFVTTGVNININININRVAALQ